MGSLASKILGRELLTLDQFAHDIVTRLAWEYAEAVVTQPRPAVLAVTFPNGQAVEYALQFSYRAYQRDPRSLELVTARFVQWVASSRR